MSHQRWLPMLLFISFSLTDCCFPLLVRADQSVGSGSGELLGSRLSVSVDSLGIGNANSGLTASSPICAYYLARRNNPCAYSERAYGAAGFRVNFFYDLKDFDFGPSIGYLGGGPGVGRININASKSPVVDQTVISQSADTIRVLGEARKITV